MGATRLTEAIRRFESETGQKADITHSRLKRLVFDGRIPAQKQNGEWTIPDPDWPEFVAIVRRLGDGHASPRQRSVSASA